MLCQQITQDGSRQQRYPGSWLYHRNSTCVGTTVWLHLHLPAVLLSDCGWETAEKVGAIQQQDTRTHPDGRCEQHNAHWEPCHHWCGPSIQYLMSQKHVHVAVPVDWRQEMSATDQCHNLPYKSKERLSLWITCDTVFYRFIFMVKYSKPTNSQLIHKLSEAIMCIKMNGKWETGVQSTRERLCNTVWTVSSVYESKDHDSTFLASWN